MLDAIFDVIQYVFLIFPQFCLGSGLLKLTLNQVQSEILAGFGEDTYKSPFGFDMLAWNLIALAVEGAVFFIITLMQEIPSCTTT